MVCLDKGLLSVLDPTDKIPQDENKTKRTHMAIAYSHVILVSRGSKMVKSILPCYGPKCTSKSSCGNLQNNRNRKCLYTLYDIVYK